MYGGGVVLCVFSFAAIQIDYIRRRQHISTIDTNSPTRGLLSQGTSNGQTYVPTGTGGSNAGGSVGGMSQMRSSSGGVSGHNPMGYCTLRNGSKQATNHSMVSVRQEKEVKKTFVIPATTTSNTNINVYVRGMKARE